MEHGRVLFQRSNFTSILSPDSLPYLSIHLPCRNKQKTASVSNNLARVHHIPASGLTFEAVDVNITSSVSSSDWRGSTPRTCSGH
jgi:hypothetical protein